jgi:hypothetical protein
MTEGRHKGDYEQGVMIDVGPGAGALIIYTSDEMLGQEIEISRQDDSKRVHTEVHERLVNGRTVFAGVFPDLAAGRYVIWSNVPRPVTAVTIAEGEVAELDWR